MSTGKHSNGPSENPHEFSARPNFSSLKRKTNGVEAKRNSGDRDRDQLPPPAAKRTKSSEGSEKNSQSDLEKLVAQTYAKGISILHQKHHDNNARRSKSKKKKKKAEKSSEQKKLPQNWSSEDETSLANVLLACAGGGGQMNMASFYEKAKGALGFDISNTQLYDKMRRMRSRFWTIHSKISEENVPEDLFAYRSPHEAALFKVWKQIWGNNVIEPNEEEDLHNTDQLPSQSNVDYFIGDEERRQNKRKVSVVENVREEDQLQTEGLIDSLHRRISAAANLELFSPRFGAEVRARSCLCSTLSRRMKELIESVRSVKEFPWLGKAEARVLQQKWHTHRVEELRVFCRSLELLQEECKLCLKELEK